MTVAKTSVYTIFSAQNDAEHTVYRLNSVLWYDSEQNVYDPIWNEWKSD